MRGDSAAANKGRFIGNLAGAPSVAETDTRYNPFDDVYGQTGDVQGNEQIEMVRNEISFSIVSLTLANLKLIRPDAQFTSVFGADGTTPVGVRITRRANIAVTDYLSNFVCLWSTSDRTIAGAYVLRKAINVNEDKTYDFNDDGTVFGVDVTMRAHTTGDTIDPETGATLPNYEERHFGVSIPS